MPQALREIMTPNPVQLDRSTNIREAAKAMRDQDIGDVVVTKDDGGLCGIVTDRDIVIRAIAEGSDPTSTTLDDVCSHQLVTLSPDDPVAKAVDVMEEHAIRRLPLVEDDHVVGIVSLGDLAVERDRESALGEISAAPPNE